jgi:alpha-galactosidase
MIPARVAIAADVERLCPSALFFNYGNPMSAVCRAVRKATGASMVGLCHGVFHVTRQLAGWLDSPLDALEVNAVGINHLTWFTHVAVDGVDRIPALRALARDRIEAVRACGTPQEAGVEDPFTWELTDLFGAFPAVLDRHVVEFFPHVFCHEDGYYGRTLGVDVFSFEETIEAGDERFARMRAVALSDAPLAPEELQPRGGEHEQVTDIVESIRDDSGKLFSANVPNRGQLSNLPSDAVIECPCRADSSGLRPLQQPPLPPGLCGTLATRFQWVETVVDAALSRSRRLLIQALLLDGSVDSIATAEALADDLLAAHTEWLGEFH